MVVWVGRTSRRKRRQPCGRKKLGGAELKKKSEQWPVLFFLQSNLQPPHSILPAYHRTLFLCTKGGNIYNNSNNIGSSGISKGIHALPRIILIFFFAFFSPVFSISTTTITHTLCIITIVYFSSILSYNFLLSLSFSLTKNHHHYHHHHHHHHNDKYSISCTSVSVSLFVRKLVGLLYERTGWKFNHSSSS